MVGDFRMYHHDGTIALWVVEHGIEGWIGDMGIIAIIPIVAFFGTGVLKKVGGALTSFPDIDFILSFSCLGGMTSSSSCGLSFFLQWVALHLAKGSRRAGC